MTPTSKHKVKSCSLCYLNYYS